MLVILAAFAASILVFCATLNLLRHRCHNNARNSRKSSLPLHFASTPNVMFAYHQCGKPSDPLVLVLHGFPDTAASMCTILSSLAAQGMFFVENMVMMQLLMNQANFGVFCCPRPLSVRHF
jgi:hypothetical protein